MPPGWPRGRSLHGGVDEIPLPDVAGRLWVAGKRFVCPDPEAALGEVGGDAVVCLCEREEMEDRYPRYVHWLEHDGRALWSPVPDLHAPPPDQARRLVTELVDRLGRGQVLLLHCGAGMGRAGTVAAAVLVETGLDLDRALATVARARPLAGPEVGAQADLLSGWVRVNQ